VSPGAVRPPPPLSDAARGRKLFIGTLEPVISAELSSFYVLCPIIDCRRYLSVTVE